MGSNIRFVRAESVVVGMDESVLNALEVVAGRGPRLRTDWHFDWPESLQQAVCRLRLEPLASQLPCLVAIVGGASSGKSTVFNNLLDGHLASRITARGHATLGPILAIHEHYRAVVERSLAEDRLLPDLRRYPIELDDDVTGEPGAVAVLFHTIDPLRNILLFDLPDFTSEGARQEGDIALGLLPWFDRIIAVVDHERWFDRQSISKLRADSVRFGHQRWVLFNRTYGDTLSDEDQAALVQQAERLASDGMTVLEFRRGRGFCLFAPGTLDDVIAFVNKPKPQRREALCKQVAEGANRVLNLNDERSARLDELHESLRIAVAHATPSAREAMLALMIPDEREQLEIVSRVLRLRETKRWLSAQTDRLQATFKQVPLIGALISKPKSLSETHPPDPRDRRALAESYFKSIARRQANHVNQAVNSSAFWDEIGKWTGLEPARREFNWDAETQGAVGQAATRFGEALGQWVEKVETESKGLSPYVKGAVGFSAVGLAFVLIAVPGPVAVLTLASAKGAVAAALTQLGAAAGAGAALGKPTGRLIAIARERLLGSKEFDAVQEAAAGFQSLLAASGQNLVSDAVAEGRALVLESNDPIATALAGLRRLAETPT